MNDLCVQVGALSKIRPAVNFASRQTAFPGQKWGPRIIPDCQLIYVIDGEAQLTLGNRIYELSTGDCVFYGENSPHLLRSSKTKPFTFYSVHFTWDTECPEPVHPGEQIISCSNDELASGCSCYQLNVDGYGDLTFSHYFALARLEHLFSFIIEEYRLNQPEFSASLRGILIQLLVKLVRNQIQRESVLERKKIAPAIEAIEREPTFNWTSSVLAELCNYHPSYFSTLFKEVMGQSPKHYLIMERIRKAKQLLLDAETVQSVAEQLGYTSVHYFCRNFKSLTGLTPTEYKQRHLEVY